MSHPHDEFGASTDIKSKANKVYIRGLPLAAILERAQRRVISVLSDSSAI